MACVGVILNPCNASLAALLCNSVENSTNAISCRFGTRRTSLKPGNWLNNIDSIISLVSSGKFVKKRIWFGGCSAVEFTLPPSVPPGAFFFLSLLQKNKNENEKAISVERETFREQWCRLITVYRRWVEPVSVASPSSAALWMCLWFWQWHRCPISSMRFASAYHRMGTLALCAAHSLHWKFLWI